MAEQDEKNKEFEEDIKATVDDLIEEIDEIPTTGEQEGNSSASMLFSNEEIARKLAERSKNADICLKWIYGIAILCVLAAWEIFVIVVMCKQSWPIDKGIQHFSDAVLIALLTSATANILALPAIILRYLFPNKGKE